MERQEVAILGLDKSMRNRFPLHCRLTETRKSDNLTSADYFSALLIMSTLSSSEAADGTFSLGNSRRCRNDTKQLSYSIARLRSHALNIC